MSAAERALGVAAGLLLDRALGEPPDAWHPVAWFGTAMGAVERWGYEDSRGAGVRHAAVGAGVGLGTGLALDRLARATLGRAAFGRAALGRAAGTVASTAAAVALASAGRMLRTTSGRIEERLVADDLEGARELLPWLVGRDPSGLDESGVAAAVVESLAENTVDAVVCPAFWGLVGGAPAVLLHRAVNTMDAMVGHRSERYARFGTAAARLDDVMAWVPARVFALVVAGVAAVGARTSSTGARGAPGLGVGLGDVPDLGVSVGDVPDMGMSVGGMPGPRLDALRTVLGTVARDAPAHPSPNAGVAEAAVAAALGVEVGGPLRYGERTEQRPRLGSGPRPRPADVTPARRLVDRVEQVLVAMALVVGAAAEARARGRHLVG